MKYPPKHHQDNDKNHMIEVIKAYPLATIISVKDKEPFITHLPLIYNENGKLIGHIDKYNPHTELLNNNAEITVIFSGPQSYISPSIFETSQLPTWNYIKVHLQGTVNAIESKNALKQSLISMTEFLEAPKHKYTLKDDNPSMEMYLDYIKMFEINILNWEGKFKLSQNKTQKDFNTAKQELIAANKKDIGDFLKKLI